MKRIRMPGIYLGGIVGSSGAALAGDRCESTAVTLDRHTSRLRQIRAW